MARLWPVWRIELWLCIVCPKNYLGTVWIKKKRIIQTAKGLFVLFSIVLMAVLQLVW